MLSGHRAARSCHALSHDVLPRAFPGRFPRGPPCPGTARPAVGQPAFVSSRGTAPDEHRWRRVQKTTWNTLAGSRGDAAILTQPSAVRKKREYLAVLRAPLVTRIPLKRNRAARRRGLTL